MPEMPFNPEIMKHAIEAANQALEEDSSNALAYYYKATALGFNC
jgi:hypothetical protein